ncbi:PilN domain-containing protein [Desulfosarcina ovata]|uniref:Fimbrial protein n=2 Tax=Desulfosarcina ovata TaxID=83564 RepID=A0A5K8AE94_9BACT|nr:PilN domain-containing protein [Desulfosarcina ovata]BBO84306.1 fimbrial protein [Desulfosarcina ovata subsp. sediminis]BBO90818.1 fimbrial protein [Desulfosarcina ovata subsp. ovata]
MIRINLLPFRAARKKENVRRQLSIFLLSLFLIVIVASWFSFYLSGKVKTLNAKIKDTKAQVEKYNKINKEIAEIKNKLAILNKKIEVIKSLDLTRKAPVELLDDMSRLVVDKQMWLTHLEDRSGKIKVAGVALDNPTVAEYMTRIDSSARYTNVKLVSINQDTSIKELKLKRFDIRFEKAPQKTESK